MNKVTALKLAFALVIGFFCHPLHAATWYVRTDGGTRYSPDVRSGQCDGRTDARYPGKGTNQHCAFGDVRYLWTDGRYCVDNSTSSSCWRWIGEGGDTYIIRGGPWRIGQSGPNANDYFGLAGNPYGAGMPVPHSGTAAAHTKILGENYAGCTAQSARTQLHGGFGVGAVLNMSGASYVDVACLDITDWSSCGRSGQSHGCNSNFPLSDYATNGVQWSNTSTNDTLMDVRIHGLAAVGMMGPTGDGVVMKDLDLIGNAGAGWNADAGDKTTGTGRLLVQKFNISWNGCAEEYPITHPLPYQDCADDNVGGYGDGFGTATIPSSPGWKAHFDEGIVSYNTQDGLDALHLTGVGSSMTVSHTLAFGNMGQQLKVGGTSGTLQGNRIFTNCNALRQQIPGTPPGFNAHLSDFCRAADSGIVLTVEDGSTAVFSDNLIYSASATAMEVDVNETCKTSTCLIRQQGNIFIGFRNDKANGYPAGGTGEFSNPLYVGNAEQAYKNRGSSFSHNTTFHAKAGWRCPATWLNETDANCGDPHLSDESWHVYGYADVQIRSQPSTTASSSSRAHGRSRTTAFASLALVILGAGGWARARNAERRAGGQ